MIDDIRELIRTYQEWLTQSITFRQIDEWIEITTPFLDRHNDYLQIYVKKEGNNYFLTDDGFILNDLISSGCALDSDKRKKLFISTINGFGIKEDHNMLITRATKENFPIKKHNLIQAMLAVNDLFYLAEPKGTKIFFEKVTEWLDENDIRYTPRVKFSGKSGYDHVFDFVIPKSRELPERILQTINNPNRTSAEMVAFSWIDIKDIRESNTKAYAILNDENRVPEEVHIALTNWEISPVLWTNRESYIVELLA